MAAEIENKPIAPEQLIEADEKYQKAIALRDKEPDTAIELLGQVLEIRNKAYGEKALECADVYLYYGELLFEQAQADTDYLGDQMKSAALQRAKQIASGEAAGGSADDAADGEAADAAEDQAMEAADAEPSEPPTVAATEQQTEKPAATAEVPAPTTPDDRTAADVPAGVAAPADAEMALPAEEGAAAEGDAAEGDAEGEDEGSEDDDDDAGESDGEDVDSGDDDAAAAGGGQDGQEQQQDAEQVTGESDDMALAWEMLEMARLIYSAHGGADKYASKLADCHMYIGDILAEQEKFEEAVPEYNTAVEMLDKIDGGLSAVKRHAAELEFKRSTALQLMDQPAEALKAIHSAKAHLQARLNELNSQLADKAGGSSTAADASGAAAFAAFASVLSSYKPPEPEAASKADSSKSPEEAAADAALQKEIGDLRSVIDSMSDRIDELKAAIDAHEDMRETIRKTFAMVTAGQGSGGKDTAAAAADGAGSSGGAAAAGHTETVGFGPAPVQAGPVQDIGVIGKGKRVAPVPVAADEAAAAAGGEGGKKRPLSDVSNSDPDAAAQETDGSKQKVQTAEQPADAKKMKV